MTLGSDAVFPRSKIYILATHRVIAPTTLGTSESFGKTLNCFVDDMQPLQYLSFGSTRIWFRSVVKHDPDSRQTIDRAYITYQSCSATLVSVGSCQIYKSYLVCMSCQLTHQAPNRTLKPLKGDKKKAEIKTKAKATKSKFDFVWYILFWRHHVNC